MAGIKDYSTTAGNNNAAPPNGFPEGMAPASLNDGMRQVMADIRSWYNDPLWRDLGNTPTFVSANTFTITGNVTANYPVGERIRMFGSVMGTLYGTISGSSFSSPNTTITVTMDSGSLTSNLSAVAIGALSTGDPIPFGAIKGAGTAASLDFVTVITGTPSDTELPTEKAVTDYVAAEIAADIASFGIKNDSAISVSGVDIAEKTDFSTGVKRITIKVTGVSSNGTDNIILQLGDSGGYETSGYLGISQSFGITGANYSSAFNLVTNNVAAAVWHGEITLLSDDGLTWTMKTVLSRSDSAASSGVFIGSGSKTLSAELTSVRFTLSGSNDFDAGTVTYFWEF